MAGVRKNARAEGGEPAERSQGTALARIVPSSGTRARVCARVITMELAEAFGKVLASDVTHTVESAAMAVGVRSRTVREAMRRYENDECTTLTDEAICEVLVKAKIDHIQELRRMGLVAAGKDNRSGTAWLQWQLEVQAPLEHPRKQKTEVELSAPGGGPIQTRSVEYLVMIPPDEPEDEPEEDESLEETKIASET